MTKPTLAKRSTSISEMALFVSHYSKLAKNVRQKATKKMYETSCDEEKECTRDGGDDDDEKCAD